MGWQRKHTHLSSLALFAKSPPALGCHNIHCNSCFPYHDHACTAACNGCGTVCSTFKDSYCTVRPLDRNANSEVAIPLLYVDLCRMLLKAHNPLTLCLIPCFATPRLRLVGNTVKATRATKSAHSSARSRIPATIMAAAANTSMMVVCSVPES